MAFFFFFCSVDISPPTLDTSYKPYGHSVPTTDEWVWDPAILPSRSITDWDISWLLLFLYSMIKKSTSQRGGLSRSLHQFDKWLSFCLFYVCQMFFFVSSNLDPSALFCCSCFLSPILIFPLCSVTLSRSPPSWCHHFSVEVESGVLWVPLRLVRLLFFKLETASLLGLLWESVSVLLILFWLEVCAILWVE